MPLRGPRTCKPSYLRLDYGYSYLYCPAGAHLATFIFECAVGLWQWRALSFELCHITSVEFSSNLFSGSTLILIVDAQCDFCIVLVLVLRPYKSINDVGYPYELKYQNNSDLFSAVAERSLPEKLSNPALSAFGCASRSRSSSGSTISDGGASRRRPSWP